MLNKQTRRILFAAILSLSVYASTWFWYHSQIAFHDQHEGLKPIAYIGAIQEDARRRPAARLIWQAVTQGEPLYPGEAIKTAANSEVRIQFLEGGRYIDLDADSLVVISASQNEISLDLMDGSLFVAGGDKAAPNAPALTLNSNQGKVDLSKATASLSKSAKGVDLQILKGQVLNEQGQALADLNRDKIKILTPLADHSTVINPEAHESVQFTWEGFPAESLVHLWLGSARKDLQPVAQAMPDHPRLIEKQIKPGKYFFKLVTTDPKNPQVLWESQVHRLQVEAKYPPSPITPLNDTHFVMGKAENLISFQWSRPEAAQKIFIEIAKDALFKEKINHHEFTNDQDNDKFGLPAGDYFWRLSATYSDVTRTLVGKPLHFSISNKPKVAVKINWQTSDVQYFVADQKALNFNWQVDRGEDVHDYKLHVWPANQGREPATDQDSVSTTPKTSLKKDVASQGSYFALVEAYNENEVLLGSSEIKRIILQPRPLLPAPIFEPADGILKADQHGTLPLQWSHLAEAKDYQLSFMDKNGKVLKSGQFTKSSTTLVNLLPGQYQVQISAVDQFGRPSEKGNPRIVIVPEGSGLQAPQLKKVQVN